MTAARRGGIVAAMAVTPERKLGLALSGGGHRAALFHLGVLARLAELDRLRKVRVISTVSGGSIIGALYYLLLRNELQTRKDKDMTPGVYVTVVQKLDEAYRKAIATSFRGLALARPGIWRLLKPTFSRTNLIAEVFEEQLYRAALGKTGPVRMSDLLITPLDNAGMPVKELHPLNPENGRRNAPVPVLVLNSTTLNTGHSFRFEAEYVGEPDAQLPLELDVDKNSRLLRVRYSDLPDGSGDRFTLGFAVSASAAFPVGFSPLAVDNMYGEDDGGRKEPFLVRLTDGGVRDNQGIDGLLDAGCTDLIISDGGGQMPDVLEPAATVVGVLPRVNSIEGTQSREQRLYHAYTRDPDADISFVHLQTGLHPDVLDPFGAPRSYLTAFMRTAATPWQTGLDAATQRLVAAIRTDLDAFSDVECFALEEVGYRACAAVVGSGEPDVPFGDWPFAAVRQALETGTDDGVERHLRIACKKFLKPLLLLLERLRIGHGPRVVLSAAGGLAATAAAIWGGFQIGPTVSAPTLYAVLVGLTFLAVLYVKSGTHGLRLLSRVVLGSVAYLPLIPLLYVGGWLMLGMGRLHVRLGRV